MQGTLAIIHTTPVTIEPLKALASELLPSYAVINLLDDSILPQLARNGGDLSAVEERWMAYTRFAEQAGAQCILSACSSVGELVARAQQQVSVPIVRIDEPMAIEAVHRGTHIGVAATLATTLRPTLDLLSAKAQQAGRAVELVPVLADEAYRRLSSGDTEGHDSLLAATLDDLARSCDVIVLAQASMARVISRLPESDRKKFLTSPRLGMQQVHCILARGA